MSGEDDDGQPAASPAMSGEDDDWQPAASGGSHQSRRVTMLSLGLRASDSAVPVFGVGKERIPATATWRPEKDDAAAPYPPPVFLYHAQAVHHAATASGGKELTWARCRARLLRQLAADRAGLWLKPGTSIKGANIATRDIATRDRFARRVLLNSVSACYLLIECGCSNDVVAHAGVIPGEEVAGSSRSLAEVLDAAAPPVERGATGKKRKAPEALPVSEPPPTFPQAAGGGEGTEAALFPWLSAGAQTLVHAP